MPAGIRSARIIMADAPQRGEMRVKPPRWYHLDESGVNSPVLLRAALGIFMLAAMGSSLGRRRFAVRAACGLARRLRAASTSAWRNWRSAPTYQFHLSGSLGPVDGEGTKQVVRMFAIGFPDAHCTV